MKLNHLITILIVFVYNCFAQSLQSFESSYIDLQEKISKEYRLLDSLNKVLSQRAQQIEIEKGKKNPDDNRVIQLMSSSASVSNNVDLHKNKVKELTKRSESLTIELSNKYNSIIDSLKNLPGNSSKKEIETQILLLTEKRLLIEPGIQNLSFKPDKILNMDVKKLNDKNEKAAYTDYLVSALNEVESVLSGINDKTDKVEEIISLQKKTQKFLKEMEFEGRPNSRRYSLSTTLESTSGTKGGFDVLNPLVGNQALNSQVYAYNLLLNQLAFDKSISSNIKWDVSFQPDKNYSLSEYRELLKEVKKNLAEYKTILRNKLASLN